MTYISDKELEKKVKECKRTWITHFNSSISLFFCWRSSVAFLKDEFDDLSSSCSFSITFRYFSLRHRVVDRTTTYSACCLAMIALLARLVVAARCCYSWLNFCLRYTARSSDFFSFTLTLRQPHQFSGMPLHVLRAVVHVFLLNKTTGSLQLDLQLASHILLLY